MYDDTAWRERNRAILTAADDLCRNPIARLVSHLRYWLAENARISAKETWLSQ